MLDLHLLVAAFAAIFALATAQSNSDCPLPDLLSAFPSFNESEHLSLLDLSLCDPETGFCKVSLDEGTVFFNGNSSGSVAFYNVSDAYCLNSTSMRECEAGMWVNEVILETVATQHFLQGWNIALIVIGALAFVIGDAVGAGLGTWLAMKSITNTDKAISIAMIVVSVLLVPPVSGPVALITFLLLRKHRHDSQKVQMKWWYKMLNVAAIILKLVAMLLWLVQAGYSATQDFYGEGPLRDKNGMCVPHKANKEEMMIQDVLVILSHAVSLVVMVDLHVKAILAKRGTKKAPKESTDSPSTPKPAAEEMEMT